MMGEEGTVCVGEKPEGWFGHLKRRTSECISTVEGGLEEDQRMSFVDAVKSESQRVLFERSSKLNCV